MTNYTTREAAAALGVSPRRVRQAIARDNIGEKRGRDWLLTQADVDYLRSRLGRVGRPPRDA
jgi:excisionase family DNA binding protein